MTTPQGGFNLGNAYGEVIIDPQRAMAGLDQAERGITGFGQRVGGAITGLGNSLSSLGGDLTVLTAPMAAFGATGVRTASQYEDALKEIEVRAGLTAEQLEEVRAKTLQLGRDTEFGPAQAADAFLQLLTSGSSVEEAMIQVDSVLAGASASGNQLGYTADALTDIMAAFNLEADQSNDVMQSLINASGSSSATFNDLVAGFANVGPMARLMGLDVDETAAILATFSENGIKGAEAGTQLRSMLNNMTRDAAPAQEAWNALGINIFDANGEIRDINDLIEEMNVQMADMTDEQRVGIIQDLAGAYGQLGLSALLTTDGYDDMLAKMDEGASLADIAGGRLDSLSGDTDLLTGSVQTLQVVALEPLIQETLRPMIQSLVEVVNGITDWVTANPELANQIVRLLAVVTAAGPALFIVGKALAAMGGLISVVLSPIGLIGAAIGGMVVAYQQNLGGFADFVNQMVNGFQRLWLSIGWFIDDIREAGLNQAILGALGIGPQAEGGSWIEGVLVNFGMTRQAAIDFVAALTNIYQRLQAVVSRVSRAITPLFEQVWTFLGNLDFGALFDALAPLFDMLKLSNPLGWISLLFDALDIDLLTIFEQLAGGATAFFGALNMGMSPITALEMAINRVFGIEGQAAFHQFRIAAEDVFNTISTFITGTVLPTLNQLYNWFVTEALPTAITFITGTAIPAIQNFIGWLGSIWNTVAPALAQLGNWFINDVLPQVVSIVTDSVIPLLQRFIQFLSDLWLLVQPHLENLANWFLNDALPAIETFISDTVLPAIQDFIDLLIVIWDEVSPHLLNLANWFLNDALPAIVEFINTTVIPVVQFLIDTIVGIWNAVQPTLQSIYDWFITTGLPLIQTQIDLFSGVIDGLITLMSGIWEAIRPTLESIYNWFMTSGLPAIVEFIGGTVTAAFEGFIGIVNGLLGAIQWVIDGLNEMLGLTQDEEFVHDPNAVGNKTIMDTVMGAIDNYQLEGMDATVQGYAIGTNYVPEDGLAYLHEGEAVIPKGYNPAAGGMMGSSGINVGGVTIYANSDAEGRAAARGFRDELDAIFERSGMNYSMGAI